MWNLVPGIWTWATPVQLSGPPAGLTLGGQSSPGGQLGLSPCPVGSSGTHPSALGASSCLFMSPSGEAPLEGRLCVSCHVSPLQGTWHVANAPSRLLKIFLHTFWHSSRGHDSFTLACNLSCSIIYNCLLSYCKPYLLIMFIVWFSLMANFVCPLRQATVLRYLVKHQSTCRCEHILKMRFTFLVAPLTIAKTWKQSKCPLTDIRRCVYAQWNTTQPWKILPLAVDGPRDDHTNEVSQAEKDKYHMISFIFWIQEIT